MKILLINHYAGSSKHGMEYRPFHLAKEWKKLGHDVTIISASFSHLHSNLPEVEESFAKETIEGIQYVWVKTLHYKGNGLKRVINMLLFVARMFYLKKHIFKNYKSDIVLASSPHPFIIYFARHISKKFGAKLIFEVRDLWPLTLKELGGMPKWHPFVLFMQHAENFAYKKSDKVVSLLPKAEEYMKAHGLVEKKFLYVPNGVNTGAWEKQASSLPQTHIQNLNELKGKNQFIVGYAGSHGLANGLDYLIDAAIDLKDKGVSVVLIGQGPEKHRLVERVEKLNLSNVHFLPSIPKSSIPLLLKEMDALYIGLKKEPLFRFGVSPNKLMDYMMAGKPVIYSVKAGNDLVAESGCGVSIQPENSNEIVKAITKLRNLSSSERKSIGENGKNFITDNHDYKVLARNVIESLE
jgi:glycosyltransferase involved in cell wall biosynthesis